MKSQRGITLTSLIIYVIAMVVVVATISTLTSYFYGNIDRLSNKTQASKEFTAFNSYFTSEVNTRGNKVVTSVMNVAGDTKIAFTSGNQFTFIKNDNESSIYYNKIKICRDVKNCEFSFNEEKGTITVTMDIAGKQYENEYTLLKDI